MSDKFMERTLAVMAKQEMNARQVCKGIGVTEGSFSQWKSGATGVTITNRRKIASFLNESLEYLETGIRKREYKTPPKITNIRDLEAFALVMQNTTVNPGLSEVARKSKLSEPEWLNIYNELGDSWFANTLSKPALFCWTMANDSMTCSSSTSYPKGAEIIFDPRIPPQEGDCILAVVDGRICFRRWAEIEGTQVLTLLNTAYNEGMVIHYQGSIWDIWVGTPIGYSLINTRLLTAKESSF